MSHLKLVFVVFFLRGGPKICLYVDISGLFLRIFFEPNSMMKCNKGSELWTLLHLLKRDACGCIPVKDRISVLVSIATSPWLEICLVRVDLTQLHSVLPSQSFLPLARRKHKHKPLVPTTAFWWLVAAFLSQYRPRPEYPTSNKSKRNWNQIDRELEENEVLQVYQGILTLFGNSKVVRLVRQLSMV